MQMRHGFATVGAIVNYQPVTFLFQSELLRDLRSFEQQMSQQLMVIRRRFRDARNGFARHKHDMSGRLRINVAKRDHQIILVNNGGGYFARGNFFKQGFAHGAGKLDGGVDCVKN